MDTLGGFQFCVIATDAAMTAPSHISWHLWGGYGPSSVCRKGRLRAFLPTELCGRPVASSVYVRVGLCVPFFSFPCRDRAVSQPLSQSKPAELAFRAGIESVRRLEENRHRW